MDRWYLRLETDEMEMGSIGEADEVQRFPEEQEGGPKLAVALHHH